MIYYNFAHHNLFLYYRKLEKKLKKVVHQIPQCSGIVVICRLGGEVDFEGGLTLSLGVLARERFVDKGMTVCVNKRRRGTVTNRHKLSQTLD